MIKKGHIAFFVAICLLIFLGFTAYKNHNEREKIAIEAVNKIETAIQDKEGIRAKSMYDNLMDSANPLSSTYTALKAKNLLPSIEKLVEEEVDRNAERELKNLERFATEYSLFKAQNREPLYSGNKDNNKNNCSLANNIDDYTDKYGSDGVVAFSMAKIIVEKYIRHGGYGDSLKFASITDEEVKVIVTMPEEWAIHSYITMKNTYGTKIRKYFVALVKDIDGDTWRMTSFRFKN